MEARHCSLILLAVLVFCHTISFAQSESEQIAHLNRAAVQQAAASRSSIADQLESALALDGIAGMTDMFYLMRSEPHQYHSDEAALTTLGRKLITAGNLSECIALLQLTTQLYPNSWQVYEQLGNAHLANGNLAEAEQCFDKATERKSTNELQPDNELHLSAKIFN